MNMFEMEKSESYNCEFTLKNLEDGSVRFFHFHHCDFIGIRFGSIRSTQNLCINL
jgi:hypothetical protein